MNLRDLNIYTIPSFATFGYAFDTKMHLINADITYFCRKFKTNETIMLIYKQIKTKIHEKNNFSNLFVCLSIYNCTRQNSRQHRQSCVPCTERNRADRTCKDRQEFDDAIFLRKKKYWHMEEINFMNLKHG